MNITETIRNILCNNIYRDKIEYMTERIQTLSNLLAKSIQPVNIAAKETQNVNPVEIIDTIDDVVIADYPYLAMDYDSWQDNLKRIYLELIDKLSYEAEIFDCDDFALIFASTVAYSAYKSGWHNQPAIGIAWSINHAFLLFICNNGDVYLYEPQSGMVIGKIDDSLGRMYRVKKVWFLS